MTAKNTTPNHCFHLRIQNTWELCLLHYLQVFVIIVKKIKTRAVVRRTLRRIIFFLFICERCVNEPYPTAATHPHLNRSALKKCCFVFNSPPDKCNQDKRQNWSHQGPVCMTNGIGRAHYSISRQGPLWASTAVFMPLYLKWHITGYAVCCGSCSAGVPWGRHRAELSR